MQQQLLQQAPNDINIEKALLGTMLLDNNTIEDIKTRLKTKNVFYSDTNRLIVDAVYEMYDKGASIDLLTVTDHLKESQKLDAIGGAYEIAKLLDHATPTHAETYCTILLEMYTKRELYRICGRTISDIYRSDCDVFEILAKTEKDLNNIVESNIQQPFLHIGSGLSEDIEALYDRIEKAKTNTNALSGVNTGFRTINLITNGWQPCDLIISAARPSVGKTAFALNLCLSAVNEGIPVGFFSLEMDTAKLRLRLIANISGVGITNISSGHANPQEVQRIEGIRNKVYNMPLFVDDNSNNTILDIKAKIRQMVNKHGVKLIVIDYLQLITPSNRQTPREQQVSEISRELKKTAKDLKIPIIALSQLSRDIEKRTDKEPTLADLRESGAIEQDADLVSFLYRFDDIVKWKLAKHRNGKTDIVDLKANYDTQTFYEADQAPENPYTGFKATPMSGTAPQLKPFNPFNEENPF